MKTPTLRDAMNEARKSLEGDKPAPAKKPTKPRAAPKTEKISPRLAEMRRMAGIGGEPVTPPFMLSEPRLVKERSQTEETSHKRCEDGTHWNEKEKKCMKIPTGIQSHVARANASSAEADKASKHAGGVDTEKAHDKAREAHARASQDHFAVSSKLKKDGFHELAAHHEKKFHQHDHSAGEHADQVSSFG